MNFKKTTEGHGVRGGRGRRRGEKEGGGKSLSLSLSLPLSLSLSFFLRVTPWFLLLLLSLSCQSAPKVPDLVFDGQHVPLEEGGYMYVIAEKDALPIMSQLMIKDMDSAQLQQMVDRTQFVTAAMYVTPNTHSRLAAWGDYPASRARMAFKSGKEWKRHISTVSGGEYWHSPLRGISVAVSNGMALVATTPVIAVDNPPDPFPVAPGTALPEGFNAFREGAILACWLNNPGSTINKKLGEMGIPIELPAERIFLSLHHHPESQDYNVRLQLQLANPSQARALAMMFALARNFLAPQPDAHNPAALLPAILFAHPPEQDGGNLNITTAPLTTQEIALLLTMFAL